MQFMVLGLNHKTAPVAVRESFAIAEETVRSGLRNLAEYENIDEAVVLSTCNRSELYAVVQGEEGAAALQQLFFDLADSSPGAQAYLYFYEGEACVRHLFCVASSLDSLVLGEGQILSQVKQAYALAREADATGTVLNTLFNRAIAVGKRVRTETHIAYNAVSVSYAAVQLAKKILGHLDGLNVLLFGAGRMAELTARNFADGGVQKIYVANRHIERAQALADCFHGEAVAFHRAFRDAVDMDVVVTSTGAPHYVVRSWETKRLMAQRQGRPLVFIDIAVPRDVDPSVGSIRGVTLYNIDDLEAVVEENLAGRRREAVLAQHIIDEETDALLERFQYLSFQPLMARLSDKAERIRRREVKRALTKLPDITPEQKKVVEHMSKMMVRKLLREPMTRLRRAAATPQEDFYAEAVRRLFKLESIGEAEKREAEQNPYRNTRQ